MRRFTHTLRTLALGAALPLCGLTAFAQPPAQPPAKPMPPAAQPAPKAAGKATYQARLINSRPETNQVVFQVRDGASTRVYTMTLAEGAKVTSGGQPASLSSFDSSAAVTITTERHGAEEKVVAIADAPADAKNLPMAPSDMDAPATGGKQTMAFPTGDAATSVLSIETGAPDQVRVGEGFDYQLKVTNISKTLTLENVVVRQAASSKLDVNPGAAPAAPAPAAPNDAKAPAGPQSPDQQSGKSGDLRWTIPAMMPGQSVTLQARAVAHTEGTVGSCFRVSYEPALCVRIRAVKPIIVLTKTAPEVQRFCDGFVIKYVVKNTGTAVAKGVVVTEQLPEGLVSTTGRDIKLDAGDLAPGQEKSLQTNVLAAVMGTYTSKAVAKGEGVSVESRATTTKFVEAGLSVAVDGPASQYVSQEINYVVTVKNDGNAPAANTILDVTLDGGSKFVRASAAEGSPAGTAGPAQDAGGKLSWNLGTLAPGQPSKVTVTVAAVKQGPLKVDAVAHYDCARAGPNDTVGKATKVLQTELKVVPALRLSLVDENDLIKVGTDVIYTLQVINQGTGPDTNLSVTLTLPPELQYVKSDGPTQGGADKQTIKFETAKQLAPGEKLTWTIHAKALKVADVRTTAALNSDYLKTPVTTTEPTRLIK